LTRFPAASRKLFKIHHPPPNNYRQVMRRVVYNSVNREQRVADRFKSGLLSEWDLKPYPQFSILN
jgi:hypothetical protein